MEGRIWSWCGHVRAHKCVQGRVCARCERSKDVGRGVVERGRVQVCMGV